MPYNKRNKTGGLRTWVIITYDNSYCHSAHISDYYRYISPLTINSTISKSAIVRIRPNNKNNMDISTKAFSVLKTVITANVNYTYNITEIIRKISRKNENALILYSTGNNDNVVVLRRGDIISGFVSPKDIQKSTANILSTDDHVLISELLKILKLNGKYRNTSFLTKGE